MQSVTANQSTRSVDSRYFLAPAGGVGWLAGIWLASVINLSSLTWLILAVPPIVGAVVFWRRGRIGLALAAFGALALGGARYAAAQLPLEPGRIEYYNGAKDVIVLGNVIAEPDTGDTRTDLRVAARELHMNGQVLPVTGVIQVQTGRFPAIPYGASTRLTGNLAAPLSLGSPSYASYLARRGTSSVMEFPRVEVLSTEGGSPIMRGLIRLKERGREIIRAALSEPQAALLTGILLGDSSGMPRTLNDAFRQTGMTHIIAISGFNIAVIIALLDYVTGPLLPRRMAAVVIMLLIALYAMLVGASASVVRASIMGITYLTGLRLMGRPTLVVAGLFSAAFLMTLAQPVTLWDVGFQLSFAATLGLMLYATPWTRRLDRRASAILTPEVRGKVVKVAAEVVVLTLAAQILTLPLLLYHFGRLSLASLPANILVLPAQPGVMVTGGLTLFLGLAWPIAGQVAGWAAWLFLNYTISIIRLLALMPGASIPLSLSASGLVVVYLVIAAATLLAAANNDPHNSLPDRLRPARKSIIAIAGLALAIILLVVWIMGRPDGRLHVAFLDVGQGDAIFIQTPTGRQLLVDGGRYPSVTLAQLGREMPFWDRSIDLVIATHPDDDHVGGLVDVLERFKVSRLITNGAIEASDTAYGVLLSAAEDRDTPIHPAQIGETILLDSGVRLEILHSGGATANENQNDASVVARLTYGDLSVLLTGDAEAGAESELVQEGWPLDAVILKAGHHGANTSSSAPFLQSVSPQVVIISAGRDNSYGHPHPAMLARVAAIGAMVLRTDESGTLELVSDGRQMWWTAERTDDAPFP